MPAASLAKIFAEEPASAFLSLIEQAAAPMSAAQLKAVMVAAGVAKSTVDAQWKTLQPLIRIHPQVRPDKRRYGWSSEPGDAEDALAVLVAKPARPLPQWLRDALGAAVAAGLEPVPASPAGPGANAPAVSGDAQADRAIRAAQERQWKIDVVRAVAELAMEAEEIAYNGADAELMLERLRTRATLHALRPIGQAGDEIAFDPALHAPLAGDPAAGSSVFVVRPGYTWHTRDEYVLIERAVVSTT